MKTKKIALIAHDGKKPEMVGFVKNNFDKLSQINLVATGTTGFYIEETGLDVDLKLSGPLGGDAQIAAMTAEGDIDAIIFFRDPQGKHAHEPDIQMLMRICDVHNTPLATNPRAGQMILNGIIEEIKNEQ